MDKPVLIAVSVFIPGYSFARVFQSILERISDSFSIHWLGLGYKGAKTEEKHYTLYPGNVNGGDIFGAYGAATLALELNAKTVLLLNDFFILRNYRTAFESLKKQQVRLMAYVPLDGIITNPADIKDALFLDELVLYHEGALREVEKAIDRLRQLDNNSSFSAPRLRYCYHGVDCNVFKPASSIQQQAMLRKKLFAVPAAEESIFILNANRYDSRKDIQSTVSGFAKALPQFQKPAFLCLHMPNLDVRMKPEVDALIENSGVKENILLNPLGEKYVGDDALVELYQACGIGLNSSYGEGWGMISFEHAACGAVQLVPAHSAPGELWKNAGILLPAVKPVQLHTNPFLMYGIDDNDLCSQLVRLVNDDAYLEMTASGCYEHAIREVFNWNNIALQWKKIL
ncbi:MAG: glycosyltransferase [Ferruginibacter sp.]